MLEQLLEDPVAAERIGGGPLGTHLASFADSLAKLGYATATARSKIEFLGDMGQWLLESEIAVADMEERVLEGFLDERRRQGRLRRSEPSTACSFVEHLRSVAAIPCREPETPQGPLAVLEGRYERFLRAERGLTTATVLGYVPFVHRFLVGRFGSGHLRLEELGPSDISSFIVQQAQSMSPGRAKLMTTALRSFFRFLLQHGEVEADLAGCVPTVADWRQSSVPKYLTQEDVQSVLDACDQGTPTGRRDYAILLLLARLGLRAGEVVRLELDDLDWRAAEITVRGKGLFHDHMPLPGDVGQALAAYLRQDRPICPGRRVFIRMKAPRRGFGNASTVSTIVRRALGRAGLDPAVKGAHLLRHSLATGILRQGGTLTEIGQILRHRARATTEIYAKVDFDGLRPLGLPWPGNGGEQ